MARIRYKKPRLSMMSTMPAIFPLRETIQWINDFRYKMPARVERGKELFLLEMAGILRDEIQSRAPKIMIGKDLVDYARDLKIGWAEGATETGAACVYFDDVKSKLTEEEVDESVLFFQLLSTSPDWVEILGRYGPWPAALVPVKIKVTDAKVISRKARPDEIQELTRRILYKKNEIEYLLSRTGAKDAVIEKSDKGIGTVVKEDVGYTVLRKEFGFDGTKQEAHWRPAIKAMQDQIPKVMNKLSRYLLTGSEYAFDIPEDINTIGDAQFKKGERFQKELAPFAKG